MERFLNSLYVFLVTDLVQNIFDIFSTDDLVVFLDDLVVLTEDLVVKCVFVGEKRGYMERFLGVFIRKFPPESFCFLTSPTSPFLLDLCGRALSGCR
jgi:hypothetical protein